MFGRWFFKNVSSHSAVSEPHRRSHVEFCERTEKILLQILSVHFYLRIIVNNFSRDRKSKRCQYSRSRMSASKEEENEQSFKAIFIRMLKGCTLESNMRRLEIFLGRRVGRILHGKINITHERDLRRRFDKLCNNVKVKSFPRVRRWETTSSTREQAEAGAEASWKVSSRSALHEERMIKRMKTPRLLTLQTIHDFVHPSTLTLAPLKYHLVRPT